MEHEKPAETSQSATAPFDVAQAVQDTGWALQIRLDVPDRQVVTYYPLDGRARAGLEELHALTAVSARRPRDGRI